MAGGLVPKTGSFKMFRDSVLDNSIADAIFGTEGTLYSNFDDLRNNCNTNMIHDSYGSRNGTPTNSEQFRGYPKPELDMDYSTLTTGTAPSATGEYLSCLPTINYSVGFVLTYNLEIFEAIDYGLDTEENNTSYATITFNAGSTSMNSSTGLTLVSGRYRLNNYYTHTTTAQDIYVEVTISSVSASSADFYNVSGQSNPHSDTLSYTAATSYPFTVYEFISVPSCASVPAVTPSSPFTVYKAGASAIANGDILYTDFNLTTYLGNSNYSVGDPSTNPFSYFRINNGAGLVQGFTTCP